MSIYKKLEELAIQLPPPARPKGQYQTAVLLEGRYLYTAGTGCAKDGKPLASGQLGREVSIEDGKAAARQCAINLLANIESSIGSLDRIARAIRTTVFVAATADFKEQSVVGEGVSELFCALFGPDGTGTRSAIGVSSLPAGQSVEIECIFELKEDEGEGTAC